MNRITIEELEAIPGKKLVIDIRRQEEYEKETYPGALHIFWEEFDERIQEIPKGEPVYLICHTGAKSDELTIKWNDKGYELYSLEGGFAAYLRRKLLQFMKEEEDVEKRKKDVERSIYEGGQ